MRQSAVKILDQQIKIRRVFRIFFHFYISFTHRLRHLSLTHILSDNNIARSNGLSDLTEDLFKICLTCTEASCSKQKNLLTL